MVKLTKVPLASIKNLQSQVSDAIVINDNSIPLKFSELHCETESGGTLEKPVQSGAEGARQTPNLSGKRTEQLICKDTAISTIAHLTVFPELL